AQALILCQNLRKQGFSVEMDLSSSAFSKQLKRADRSGAIACVILGETEACDRTVQLKWLISGEQESFLQKDLINQSQQLREKLMATKSANSSS
ncbi:MAG: histidine--tRNA ligase, partial [Acaryochloris sp. RU_4_1]|nr:histidine--tRNA ligase [Acaryochloris sp. RU_4_1]